MNTILLQKILDILREGLAHVGNFFKDLFVSDPQNGQVIAYDAESGHWVNKDATEVELDLTNTFEAQAIATLTDGAENVPMQSLVVDIVPKQASGTPTPDNPLPISGFSSVTAYQNSKNLVILSEKAENTTNGIKSKVEGDNLIVASGTSTANAGDIAIRTPETYLKAGTYTVSFNGTDTRSGALICYLQDKNTGLGNRVDLASSAHSYQITLTKDITLVGLLLRTTNNHTITMNAKYQIEVGSTASTYESPTQQKAITIALPSTVYGGEVDVVSGQGTITKGYIASYNGESINEPWISSMDVYTTGGTPTTGAQVVYPLTTPTPITTTPTTIKTQGGTESIWSDAGDVIGEYYTKTAGDVKSLVCITEDITSEITKNTTDFSEILLKVSQNNKVVSIEIYNATTAEAVNDTFLSNLPKPAMNCPVMVLNKTVGEEGIFYGSLSTSGALNITVPGAKSFGGLITYVAK